MLKVASRVSNYLLSNPSCFLDISVIFSLFALTSGDVRGKIFAKLDRYVSAGKGVALQTQNKDKGYSLSYLDVFSTVREASGIPKEVVRNRILADTPTCSCPRCLSAEDKKDAVIIPTAIFGLLGVVLLILRYWEFCMAVPFLAIAYFCFQGQSVRFTVHVGNVASLGIIFLILCVLAFAAKIVSSVKTENSLQSKSSWAVWIAATEVVVFLLRPNIQHAQNYHSHVVYPTKTIEILQNWMKYLNQTILLLLGGTMVRVVGFMATPYFTLSWTSDIRQLFKFGNFTLKKSQACC